MLSKFLFCALGCLLCLDFPCCTKKYWLISNRCTSTCLSFVASGLFILSECNNEQIVLFIICINPNIGNLIDLSLKLRKIISRVISGTVPLHILHISYACHLYCMSCDVSNMVSFVCKTRSTLVANYSYIIV